MADVESGGNSSRTGPRGLDLWRKKAHAIILINRLNHATNIGTSPGLDIKRHSYVDLLRNLHMRCKITVVDYSRSKVTVNNDLSNRTLEKFLSRPRPLWSKVRWINCEGISWDVIELLAVTYDLHPLAVEDIVHLPQR